MEPSGNRRPPSCPLGSEAAFRGESPPWLLRWGRGLAGGELRGWHGGYGEGSPPCPRPAVPPCWGTPQPLSRLPHETTGVSAAGRCDNPHGAHGSTPRRRRAHEGPFTPLSRFPSRPGPRQPPPHGGPCPRRGHPPAPKATTPLRGRRRPPQPRVLLATGLWGRSAPGRGPRTPGRRPRVGLARGTELPFPPATATPPCTYPRAGGAPGRGGRSPSARTVPSCESLRATDRDEYFNGNNRKRLLSSDRGSLTTGDV